MYPSIEQALSLAAVGPRGLSEPKQHHHGPARRHKTHHVKHGCVGTDELAPTLDE
jgi:hypothetical protein